MQVVLTWRYGGLSASVAGDLVGSWATRMPLMRCKNPFGCKGSVARGAPPAACKPGRSSLDATRLAVRAPLSMDRRATFRARVLATGNFFLELTGLRPGVYYYKYIVDGTWAVDPAAPKVRRGLGRPRGTSELRRCRVADNCALVVAARAGAGRQRQLEQRARGAPAAAREQQPRTPGPGAVARAASCLGEQDGPAALTQQPLVCPAVAVAVAVGALAGRAPDAYFCARVPWLLPLRVRATCGSAGT